MIRKVQSIKVPRVVPLDEPFQEFLEKDGVKIHTFAWNRVDSGNLEKDEYIGAWTISVPVSLLLEVWLKVGPATREGKLGYMSDMRISPNDSNRRFIWVHLRDWKDEKEVERVKDELKKLGIVEDILEYVRYRKKTEEEERDEVEESILGPELSQSYRQLIRSSGLLKAANEPRKAERAVLWIMIEYGGRDESLKIVRKEFKDHKANVEKLIEGLCDVEKTAFKLMYTNERDFGGDEAYQLGYKARGESKPKDSNPCSSSTLSRFWQSGWFDADDDIRAGQPLKEQKDLPRMSPRDEGIFSHLAEPVLLRLEGLVDQISDEFQKLKELFSKKGRPPQYDEAWIVTQFVDTVNKFCCFPPNAYARVALFLRTWPHWQGKEIGEDAVEKKHGLIKRKK